MKGVTEYHKEKSKALCDVDILNSLFFVHITFCHSLRYTAPVFLTPRMLCHSPLLLYIRCPRCGRTDDSVQSLSHQPILCPKPTTERGRKKAKAISRPSRLTRKYTASPTPAPPPLQPEVLQKVTALQTHPSPDTIRLRCFEVPRKSLFRKFRGMPPCFSFSLPARPI